ncbi:MAG TPA: hypothetical protein VK533_14070 [Sphingomonas sp.]|uniref:hypothetical protein n=1 Tax=Sphingomonas sp. TaxID=28214 RepID=UPI002B6B454F|nr:hypothetical protein [Sphingomonas sp.]HMI20660.1 hypothetical protein [Sphingomonas sp.]
MTSRSFSLLLLAATFSSPASAGIFGSHAKDCIPRHGIRAETAESETSLIFHAKGAQAYRNTLPAPCEGLVGINGLSELAIRPKDDDLLCAGDLVWLRQKGLFSSSDSSDEASACKLGSFEGISETSLTEFLRR